MVRGTDGRWTQVRRAVLPIEQHNAEISLLTGICAARIMLDGRVGLLRTLPPPSAEQVALLRRATAALGIGWPESMPVSEVIAGLDGNRPRDAAFLEDAVRLLRGAGYTASAIPSCPGSAPPWREPSGRTSMPCTAATSNVLGLRAIV